jgi:hypothetical protein
MLYVQKQNKTGKERAINLEEAKRKWRRSYSNLLQLEIYSRVLHMFIDQGS